MGNSTSIVIDFVIAVYCVCFFILFEVISGSAIEHLASEDHWKRVKGFMWKYGGGMDRVDLFRIAEADYAKVLLNLFEDCCTRSSLLFARLNFVSYGSSFLQHGRC